MGTKDLSLIQAFTRVVETRSFRLASEDLTMMPSSISRQVARLEELLGVQLLVRTTRHVHPTEAGLALYNQCTEGIGQIEAAWDAVSRFRNEPQGMMRIRATPCFGQRHVVPAIIDFLALFPKVTVDLSLEHSGEGFMEYGTDVQIRGSLIQGSKKLSSKNIATMPHVICAAPAYLKNCQKISSPKDLENVNCLVNSRSSIGAEWPFIWERRRMHVSVSGNFITDDFDGIHVAALLGQGIARLPEYLAAPDLKSGRLIHVLRELEAPNDPSIYSALTYTMLAYYDRNRLSDAKVARLIEFLSDRFEKIDWNAPRAK